MNRGILIGNISRGCYVFKRGYLPIPLEFTPTYFRFALVRATAVLLCTGIPFRDAGTNINSYTY